MWIIDDTVLSLPVMCMSWLNHLNRNWSKMIFPKDFNNELVNSLFKGLITVGRELRQQHPSDLLSGAGTSRERSSRDVPAGQQIVTPDRPWSIPIITWLNNVILHVFTTKKRSKSPPNRATSPTCLHCDVTHLSLTTGVVALHIPSRRVGVREEHRQARKIVWPVKGAVTCAVCPESAWLVTFLIGNVSTGVVTWSALRCGASGESGKKVAAAPLSKTAAAAAAAKTWFAKHPVDYMLHNRFPWKRSGRRSSMWPPYSLRRNLSAAACRPCDRSLMQVEWFVAIKIIYVESSITINISESVFVMYKSQV